MSAPDKARGSPQSTETLPNGGETGKEVVQLTKASGIGKFAERIVTPGN